ncbi:prolyl oligopeptidase family serine peptidase [Streptomyces sp. YIM 98790]|uniref:S9 family peptidase n=1 Tax=Streptomyces sp. YIM 98790 TaxID=2689077 RepID=UPI00140CD91D|nr:prolyl oligopeptidase family serine peptidase [Streptomyces sp. YIM 98790]
MAEHTQGGTSAGTGPGTAAAPGAGTGAGAGAGTEQERPDRDWSALPAWEQRFRAPRVGLPEWAPDAPDRCLFVSNASGTFELYAWDRATGTQRQATRRPNGTVDGTLTPDGEWLWWFNDHDGDEFGIWMRQPFHGGPDEPALPGLEPSYPAGLAIGRDGTVVVGRITDEHGSTVHVARPGAGHVEIYRHRQSAGVGGVSRDGSLLAVEHTEHGDAMHSAVRVLRLDGTPVAELDDTRGGTRELGLTVHGFAPVAGDPRLLLGHQRRDRWEPMIWNPLTGETLDLAPGLPGDVHAEWYPDGSALLLLHDYRARTELWRLDLTPAEGQQGYGLSRVETPAGTVSGATARPGGGVEYLWSSAAEPPRVRSTAGPADVLVPPGPRPPASLPVTDAWVDGPGGPVHALVQRPADGEGPFPTVFDIHGGPAAHDSDAFAAGPAAWLDHGFAVVRINYRGSTGYGREWTDALKHRVGLIELEDIAAVRAWAVEFGLADPERLVLTGASWGGYLTLLGLGTQPELWTVGVAAVPVADYVTAYGDEMEALKALDRTLFGGTPEEVPERFAASSPLSYADQVKVPVFISAGENDPRCPVRQIENYVRRLAERGAVHEVYRYDAGHGSLVMEERIKQVRMEIDFALRHLPPDPRRS